MEPSIDDKVFWDLSYGLYVLTARDGEKKNGQILTVAMQVTAEPVRLAVCVHRQNLTCEYIRKSRAFGISVLEQETPFTFIGLWGFKSGRNEDKFSQAHFKLGREGTPLLLDHTLSVIECKVVEEVEIGTHSLFLGEVLSSEVVKPGLAMTYEYYYKVLKGKVSKNAPTYHSPQAKGKGAA